MNPPPSPSQPDGAGRAPPSQVIKAESGGAISHVTQIIAEKYVASRSQAEELSDYLARAVAAYEARMYQRFARPPAPPDRPYKFLYAFEIEDAGIFFGREAAGEALHRTVLQDRLTVLHAKSGAGKTSLLHAGLSPRLIREGRLPVHALAEELVTALGGPKVVQSVLAERGSHVRGVEQTAAGTAGSVRQEVVARDQSTVEDVQQRQG